MKVDMISMMRNDDGGLGGLRSHDLQLRRLPRYPCCATSPPNYSLTNSLHIQLTVYTWSYNS